MNERVQMVAAVLGAFVLLELLLRRFPWRGISARDTLLDVAAFSQAAFLVGPLVVFGTAAIETALLPRHAGAWQDVAWYWQLLAFLIFEDMVQYWWHRASHAFPRLWPAHKFHHTPPYMGVRIIWRNGFFYDLLMPNLWLAGILVYLGFAEVYLWYQLAKLVITMGAHSELRWDAVLYRHRFLHPLAWVIERTLSTPATHFAHHAYAEDDGIGHYNGNYGNLLFLWDVLFGTARITRQYPPRFGLKEAPGDGEDPWYVLIFYPLFRRRRNPGQGGAL
jgi:sterol desaturase/sphingolipid hydroxylase (fatty acid hydroxylase superfamily)